MSAPATAAVPSTDDKRGATFAWVIWALIIVAGIALALIRVMAVNLPWHLATARLAQETGHWPAVNTFSYTFPDYPVYQQYPAFQATMWAIFRAAGWGGAERGDGDRLGRGVPARRALGGAAAAGRALSRALDAGAVGAAAAHGVAPRHVHDARVRRPAAGAGRVRARPDARAGAGAARASVLGQQPPAVAAVADDPGAVPRRPRAPARLAAARAWPRWRSARRCC